MIKFKDHLTSDPGIMSGKPAIRGPRIPVELLLKKPADGFEAQDIIGMCPYPKRQDILALLTKADRIWIV